MSFFTASGWIRGILVAVILILGIVERGVSAQTVTHTVDASTDWVFISLSSPTALVEVDDPAASPEWDLAFLGTEVMVNGGAIGPANLTAYCFCRNQAATGDQLQLMTPEEELAAFEAITAADVPTDPAAWDPGIFSVSRWFRYNLRGEHFIWPTYDVYLLKRGDTVHKLQIIGYYGPAGEPRQIELRYAELEVR